MSFIEQIPFRKPVKGDEVVTAYVWEPMIKGAVAFIDGAYAKLWRGERNVNLFVVEETPPLTGDDDVNLASTVRLLTRGKIFNADLSADVYYITNEIVGWGSNVTPEIPDGDFFFVAYRRLYGNFFEVVLEGGFYG